MSIESSIIRTNLMKEKGYTPYCGNDKCTMPRTTFYGEQFVCDRCGWISSFPTDFIDEYKKKWGNK